MSASTAMSAEPHSSDEAALIEYRAISRAALVALGLGLASPLVLVSPLLILVPLAAAIVAAIALRSIAASSGQLSGRRLAIVGLCLAALFAGWGLARPFSRQGAVAGEAQRFADEWLAVVRDGKLQLAHQFQKNSTSRILEPAELAKFYATDENAAKSLSMLFASEPLKSFIAVGPTGEHRCVAVAQQTHFGYDDKVTLEYVYGPGLAAGGQKRMWISVMRTQMDPRLPAEWVIQNALDTPPVP